MGSHEEFLCSKKYSLEQIGEQIQKTYKNIEPQFRLHEIICKATLKKDVDISETKIFGKTSKIKPIKMSKGTEGLIIHCEEHISPLKLLPFFMRRKVESRRIDDFLCRTDGIQNYEDTFLDQEIKIGNDIFQSSKENSCEDAMKRLKELNIDGDDKFRYLLLGRMQQDCYYYLGNGDRNTKHLWAKDEKEQIQIMKDLYLSFPSEKKPEWITMEEIREYEEKMGINKAERYDRILMGDDLNGSKENAVDLEVSLVTGKDLDGVNIPNDTPEERNKANIKERKEEAIQMVANKKEKKQDAPHIEKKEIIR